MTQKIDVYHIDSGVPVPLSATRRTLPPLRDLELGESIVFPLAQRFKVQQKASKLKARTGKVFTIRKMDEQTARVWRVE